MFRYLDWRPTSTYLAGYANPRTTQIYARFWAFSISSALKFIGQCRASSGLERDIVVDGCLLLNS